MKLKFKALVAGYFASLVFIIMYVIISISYGIAFNYLLSFSVFFIIIFIPYGFFDSIEMKKFYESERRVPDFLRDLAEYTTFGMPISQAIVRTSNADYGPLSDEIKRVASLISWGLPVEDALADFGKSMGSDNVIRAGKVIVKASESGSNISDVMTMVSDFNTQMQLLRNQRFSEMKNYTMVMLISFGVFLFVILALDVDFLPHLGAGGFSLGGGSGGPTNVSTIEQIFNIGLLVQGGGTGILSGVLRDGRISSGAFLAGIMLAVSVVILAMISVV
ncbi:MAG: type II secretion system F family protein [Candidatus Thermoplasmatota archaeon]|nr:type II secretion system F family protein [Candidatus Thermoplasmatota archaeon]MCL5785565.1 type II secretion system F family protein [Candidatus Thermoplasmatota archaeon]